MSLRELYQEVILDHSRHPRNARPMPEASRSADGFNALCGDRVTIHVHMEGDRVADLSFEGSGCAISTASASTLTEALVGKTAEEARELFDAFHALVTGEGDPGKVDLGKLVVFGGVSEFPMRVKCATLAWHTFRAALDGQDAPVSTE